LVDRDLTADSMIFHPDWASFVRYCSSLHCNVRFAISLISFRRFIADESSEHFGIPFDSISWGSWASSDSGGDDDDDDFDDFEPALPLPEPPPRAPRAELKQPGRAASSRDCACRHCGVWPCAMWTIFCAG